MKIFKNKVGRPSNEIIKKRRIITSLVCLFVIILGVSLYFILNNNITNNRASIFNSSPVLKVTPLFSKREVAKGTVVNYSIRIKNLTTERYYYMFTVNMGNQSQSTACTEFSNINKLKKYNLKISHNNTFIKYAIYYDSNCTKEYKSGKTRPVNIKEITTTTGKTKTLTAKFKANGADSIGDKTLSCTTKTGTCTVKAPTIARKGYKILGWSEGLLLSSKYKVGDEITLKKRTTTFYAKTRSTFGSYKVKTDYSYSNNNSKVAYDTLVDITAKFINETEDKYYFKWTTYSGNELNFDGDCIEFKNGDVKYVSLKINDVNRYGMITIYKDSTCKTKYKSYKTNRFSANDYVSNNSINEQNSYHYSLLNARQKKIYKYLYDKKDNFIKGKDIYFSLLNVSLGSINSKEVMNVHESLYLDHPEFFLINTYNQPTYYSSAFGIISMSFLNKSKASTLSNKLKSIDSVVNKVVANAKKKHNDYEKVKYVHDYIINNMSYKLNTALSIDGYTVKTGQCMTYAFMMTYALNKLNIKSIYVTGKANGGAHAWNYVNLNNKWYFLDATWDDTSNLARRYFLLGSNSKYSKGHVPTSNYKYPTLSKSNY